LPLPICFIKIGYQKPRSIILKQRINPDVLPTFQMPGYFRIGQRTMGLVLIAFERTTVCLMHTVMVGVVTIGWHVAAFITLFPTHRKYIFPPLKYLTENGNVSGRDVHIVLCGSKVIKLS